MFLIFCTFTLRMLPTLPVSNSTRQLVLISVDYHKMVLCKKYLNALPLQNVGFLEKVLTNLRSYLSCKQMQKLENRNGNMESIRCWVVMILFIPLLLFFFPLSLHAVATISSCSC